MENNSNLNDNKIISRILQLDKKKKCILILSEIKRQEKVIAIFDKIYTENLCDVFNTYINIGSNLIKDTDTTNISNIMSVLENLIPDTDEYSEIEGTFAQNGIISLVYFFKFYNSEDNNNLIHSM